MAIVVKTRTYNTGDQLTAPYYNDDRDEVIAGINDINNAQINAAAGINETKIAFAGTGHGHGGNTDGEKVKVTNLDATGMTANEYLKVDPTGTFITSDTGITGINTRYFAWYLGKTLVLETNAGINPIVPQAMVVSRIAAYVKTPSVGADIIVVIKNTLGTTIGTLTIPAGSNSAITTVITAPNLTSGWFLQLDVTQIGIGTAGANITVTVEATI